MRCSSVVFALAAALLAVAPPPAGAACPGDCDASGAVTIDELIMLVDIGLSGLRPVACSAGDLNDDGLITIEELIAAVSSALLGCPATPTASPAGTMQATATPTAPPTATPTGTPAASRTATESAAPTGSTTPSATASETRTRTATPSVTRTATRSSTATSTASPTPGLGTRRFSLDPQSSRLQLLPDLGTFDGFTGFLDLAAGPPDPVTGLATVNVVGASEFLSVQVGFLTVCIKPIIPVLRAGVLACNGGVDLGVSSVQDHNIGTVGMAGFTAQECDAAGGTVEAPEDPHPGVCNGPVDILPSPEDDSGVGALMIAPDARFETEGLPTEVTIEPGDCADHGAGEPTVFGFVSGVSRAAITDANNAAGATFQHDEDGANFSCPLWMQEDGPGRLVLSVPAVHAATSGDLITVFVLDD